jgi:hypothetical protein
MTARLLAVLAALVGLLGLPACGGPQEPVRVVPGAGALYDAFYPDHVEICAMSQIRPYGASHGGSAGHAAMYLSGVCPREDAPYPLLRLCDEGGGAGVSVNKMFRNVNWVAIPERRLFLHGRVGDMEPLTTERIEATVREALELGVFRGVRTQDEVLAAKPAGMSEMEFIARESIGTDFALKYGRSLFCAKLPVTRAMLAEIVTYLNELNRRYAEGGVDYEWSGYHDNCTHTIHNALADAGIWKPKSINQIKLLQLFHLAVPANEFIDLAQLGNDYPIEELNKVQRDPSRRETLLRHGWLPARHGALIEVIPVHEPNEVYEPEFKLFVLEGPLRRTETREARRMIRDPRYSRMKANLLHFRTRYRAILQGRSARGSGGGELGEAAARYVEVIERELADVEDKLGRLEERERGGS